MHVAAPPREHPGMGNLTVATFHEKKFVSKNLLVSKSR